MATHQEIKEAAEADLVKFIKLVAPQRLLGNIHKELIGWWTREEAKSHQLVLLPRGHMKAQSLDSKVLTPTGFCRIGDLEVGDEVIGSDGKPTRVVYLHPVQEMDLYKVSTRDGRETLCNDDHMWTVQCPSNTGDRWITKSLFEIRKNFTSPRYDKRDGSYHTEYRYFLPTVEPIEFEDRDLLVDPYTLGAWLGDGNSDSGGFTTADPEVLNYFPYRVSEHKARYHYGLLGLPRDLKRLGVLGNKYIPEEYLTSSVRQREALLQGLLDTDGTLHRAGNWIYFSQCKKRERLVDDLISLVRSLGGHATKHEQLTSCDGQWFESFVVSIKVPASIKPFKLNRKARAFKGSKRGTRSAITNIEYAGRRLGRCITVENEDGLYVTDDYMMTHNSALIAYRVAWEITRNPAVSVLYISATSGLAEEQLGAVKDILTSSVYRKFWPEMVNKAEGQRERWTAKEIKVDHPTRKYEGVRDPTVFTGGLTTSLTGYHCDIAVLDDVVVQENAYTEEGRQKVKTQYSLLSSIENPGAKEWVVGTRYHPKDLYEDLLQMKEDIFDSEGNVVYSQPIYETFQRQVEDRGDGTGEFIWPRSNREDGAWFGFNTQILMTKKAQYLDKMQYWAQYYNNPNDPENRRIDETRYQYYDQQHLQRVEGKWYYRGRALNVYAAIDLAYTKKAKSDYTVIVVIGIDRESNIYVLDIDRFQTDRISEYFNHIRRIHTKWDVRKLRAETTGAQSTVVRELKDQYIKPEGLILSIDEFYPTRHMGTKEERIAAALEPRYENLQVWHYKGGNIQALEQELSLANPPHDDIKDALASAVDIAVPPRHADRRYGGGVSQMEQKRRAGIFNRRFGGVDRGAR